MKYRSNTVIHRCTGSHAGSCCLRWDRMRFLAPKVRKPMPMEDAVPGTEGEEGHADGGRGSWRRR